MADEPGLNPRPLIIWWIKDGKVGHEKQCQGLIQALKKHRPCDIHEFIATTAFSALSCILLRRFPPGKNKPKPDLILAAGHQTHLSLISAKRAYQGITVVLMKPSLPLGLFDLCLIPKHDQPTEATNVIETDGAINTQTPSQEKHKGSGLILLGGLSKHYDWNNNHCLEQIRTIVEKDKHTNWVVSDSRRTPKETSAAIKQLDFPNLSYMPFQDGPKNWLDDTLQKTDQVWVSEDSASMVYEALSAGCKTGVLEGTPKKPNKLSDSIASLSSRGMVVRFADWKGGKVLSLPKETLCEAKRIAKIIINRFFND